MLEDERRRTPESTARDILQGLLEEELLWAGASVTAVMPRRARRHDQKRYNTRTVSRPPPLVIEKQARGDGGVMIDSVKSGARFPWPFGFKPAEVQAALKRLLPGE